MSNPPLFKSKIRIRHVPVSMVPFRQGGYLRHEMVTVALYKLLTTGGDVKFTANLDDVILLL